MVVEAPSIWREEIWHPLSVHLPIATLFLSSVAGIVSLAIKNIANKAFIEKIILLMLCVGVVSGWVAIFTGEMAYSIEVRKICDPKVLQAHQWWSYTTIIIYSVVFVFKIVTLSIASNLSNLIGQICCFLLIAALFGLVYTGHLGASLVYQQGAGVLKFSEDCSEFVK